MPAEKVTKLKPDTALDNAITLGSPPIDELQKLAKIFAGSDFIPEHYRRKPDNCFIALYSAWQLKIEPLAFMRHTYVVHGNLGIDGQMVIALANERGFSVPIDWKFKGQGDAMECTAFATTKAGKEVSITLSWATVKAEGWTRNQKWLTMREQMFRYRSATFLTRAYCPEVLLGLPRPLDELEDIEDSQTAAIATPLDAVADALPSDVEAIIPPPGKALEVVVDEPPPPRDESEDPLSESELDMLDEWFASQNINKEREKKSLFQRHLKIDSATEMKKGQVEGFMKAVMEERQ